MLFLFSQDDHVKKETECSETSGTSQGRTIKRKTRSLIFQRRGAEHTLDVFALADLDWVYLLWALLINTLGKQLAELLCTVIFFPPSYLWWLESMEAYAHSSMVDGALLGSVEQKTKLFTGNTAASEVAPSLGVQNTWK